MTSYPELDALLNVLCHTAQEILADNFAGMYLYGSLATGDFDRTSSDIDFLVVTHRPASPTQYKALETWHTIRWKAGDLWALRLEGSYAPLKTVQGRFETEEPCPSLNEGAFYLGTRGSEWTIIRHILTQHGATVAGLPVREWLEPVSENALRQAVCALLETGWKPLLNDPKRLHRSEYQAYAALTLARMCYTLQEGDLISKRRVVEWAEESLPMPFSTLVSQASGWKPTSAFSHQHTVEEFLRYALQRAQVRASAIYIPLCPPSPK